MYHRRWSASAPVTRQAGSFFSLSSVMLRLPLGQTPLTVYGTDTDQYQWRKLSAYSSTSLSSNHVLLFSTTWQLALCPQLMEPSSFSRYHSPSLPLEDFSTTGCRTCPLPVMVTIQTHTIIKGQFYICILLQEHYKRLYILVRFEEDFNSRRSQDYWDQTNILAQIAQVDENYNNHQK